LSHRVTGKFACRDLGGHNRFEVVSAMLRRDAVVRVQPFFDFEIFAASDEEA